MIIEGDNGGSTNTHKDFTHKEKEIMRGMASIKRTPLAEVAQIYGFKLQTHNVRCFLHPKGHNIYINFSTGEWVIVHNHHISHAGSGPDSLRKYLGTLAI